MKGLPGKARARILDNMSPRLAVMLAEDVLHMGPVRMRDVEEECVKIMRTVIRLSDSGEILAYDLSIPKVVIDLHESAERENKELRNKYRELRDIINEIFY